MGHKEKYCAYWACERNGGTTCWNWGGKFAGQKCPQNDTCEHWRTCEMCNGVIGQCKTKIAVERGKYAR